MKAYEEVLTYELPLDAVPELIKARFDIGEWSRKGSVTSRQSRPSIVQQRFKKLPAAVQNCILEQLKVVHMDSTSTTCAKCHVRDLYNLSLTSRTWDKATRKALYHTLWLTDSDFSCRGKDKKAKAKTITRIKLLRRTLRDRSALARLVFEINAWGVQSLYKISSESDQEEIQNIVASIVMTCPNLERLAGFYPIYRHRFDRLSHALSTRSMLKERVWIIQDEEKDWKDGSSTPVDSLYDSPTELFLQQNMNWPNLQSLFLHGLSDNCMDFRAFVATMRGLPSLRHLLISAFSAEDFNDRTLQALPANLESLRLERLPGITDKGFSKALATNDFQCLRTVALIGLEIVLLPNIARTMSLPRLKRFTLMQDGSPAMLPGAIMARPLFRSATLKYIHWDVLIPGQATEELGASIAAGAFPTLRTLRAPSDHDGILQDVCKPLAEICSDKHLIARLDAAPMPRSDTHYLRSLAAARKAAQERIEAARLRPKMRVLIEIDGMIQRVHTIRDYMGTLGSEVRYALEPDVPRHDRALADVGDLVADTVYGEGQQCFGSRNWHNEKSWHQPMRRGGPYDPMRFF